MKINGTTTAKTQIDNMPARGTLALSADSRGHVFHFRKIEIKELPPDEPGWVQHFNGPVQSLVSIIPRTNPAHGVSAW